MPKALKKPKSWEYCWDSKDSLALPGFGDGVDTV